MCTYTGLDIYVIDRSQEQHVRSFNKGIDDFNSRREFARVAIFVVHLPRNPIEVNGNCLEFCGYLLILKKCRYFFHFIFINGHLFNKIDQNRHNSLLVILTIII